MTASTKRVNLLEALIIRKEESNQKKMVALKRKLSKAKEKNEQLERKVKKVKEMKERLEAEERRGGSGTI